MSGKEEREKEKVMDRAREIEKVGGRGKGERRGRDFEKADAAMFSALDSCDPTSR